jgi:hypothetical protein
MFGEGLDRHVPHEFAIHVTGLGYPVSSWQSLCHRFEGGGTEGKSAEKIMASS